VHYYSYKFEQNDEYETSNELVVFLASDHFDLESFLDLIESHRHNLAPSAVIIIVRQPCYRETISSIQEDSTAKDRLQGDTPILVLAYDQTGDIVEQYDLASQNYTGTFDLQRFKRVAITSIFENRQGLINSTNLYHFRNPSQRHSTKFIRLANILSEPTEISFLAFCCLPFLPVDCKIAYVDTPALLPLIFSIKEQLKEFDKTRSIIPINFESYFRLPDYDFKYRNEAVVIISASTSGGLARTLLSKFAQNQIFHILYLGFLAPIVGTVCDLRKDKSNPYGYEPIQAVEESVCDECMRHSVFIPIESDQFTFAGPQDQPIILAEDHLHKDSRSFLECSVGADAMRVGLGDTIQSVEDHEFYIHLSPLLVVEEFKRKLNYLVDKSFPSRAINIIFATDDSRELATHIANRVGLDPSTACLDINKFTVLNIEEDRPIVIVADAVETGRSLQDISRQLRRLSSKVPLVYFIGVSKTSGEYGRESLKSTLAFAEGPAKHVVEIVHSIILPQFPGVHPWLQERRLLLNSDFQRCVDEESRGYFAQRLSVLSLSDSPLLDNLFVPNVEDGKLLLQPGFAFWKGNFSGRNEFSEADVFFSIATVLQNARALGHSKNPGKVKFIRSNWLQQTLLDPQNFRRFDDSMIQASFLRAAHPRELNYSCSNELSQKVHEFILEEIDKSKSDVGSVCAELLLALATQQLRLTQKHMTDLASVENRDLAPITKALLKFCQTQRSA
jgi:hypothetical protein